MMSTCFGVTVMCDKIMFSGQGYLWPLTIHRSYIFTFVQEDLWWALLLNLTLTTTTNITFMMISDFNNFLFLSMFNA